MRFSFCSPSWNLIGFAMLQIAFIGNSFSFLGNHHPTNSLRTQLSIRRSGPLYGQSLDYTSLYLSVDELAQACVPGKVENVVQENEYNIFLGMKTATGQNVWLQFCWHPSAARIGLGYAPPRGETTPYSFAATLRSLLRGHSVTKVHIPTSFDRIAEVEFSERLSDEKPKWRLILEVMGARSNAILVSEEDNIIQACAYQVSSSTTVRPLQTGGVYQRPPSGGGIFSPLNKEKVDIEERLPLFSTRMKELDVTVEKSLVSCYRGMSPNIAHRILDAAEVECSVMVRSLTDIQISNIFKYFSSWAMIFENSEGSVGSTLSQSGSSSYSSSGPSSASSSGSGSGSILKVEPLMIQYPGKKSAEFCPISFVKENSIVNEIDGGSGIRVSNLLAVDELVVGTTVDSSSGSDSGSDSKTAGDNLILSKFLLSYYSLYERKTAFELLHSACEKKVALRMKKADKILKDFQTQEKDAKGEKCDDLKALGDLITSFTHSYQDKSQVLQCYDFITGEPILVPIPIGVTPSDHAKNMYLKAKRLKRSLKVLDNLIVKASLHVDYLSEIEAAISGLAHYVSYEDISTLLEIEEELNGLEQLTIIQLGDSITPGETASNGLEKEKNENTDKDKKKSKSKLKSGKQTKSTKTAPVVAKKNTNTAPSSKKKALQGLLVLRPAQVNYMNAKISGSSVKGSVDSDNNSDSDSDSNFESTKKGDKKDKKDRDSSSLAPTLPPLVVGRSSKQNDRITFEIAKEHHLWFHVQGSPGSHVLLQLEPGDQPSPEGIQYAADVASFYSKARGSTKVPVGYCSPKHIRRITGGSPGMVSILQQTGVVYGSPDKGKLWVEKYGPQTMEVYR